MTSSNESNKMTTFDNKQIFQSECSHDEILFKFGQKILRGYCRHCGWCLDLSEDSD